MAYGLVLSFFHSLEAQGFYAIGKWVKCGELHAIDISYILDNKDPSLLVDLNLLGNKI